MNKSSDFRNKEVISINSGKRLGFVSDVDINFEKGTIDAIIVPGPSGILNFFSGGNNDYVIPWNNIKKVGDDIILVDYIMPKDNRY
jgi:YlmC/YmxH family sporulation protein